MAKCRQKTGAGGQAEELISRLSMVAALAAAKRDRRERAVARAPRSARGWPWSPIRSG